jgi:hypothetical protein
MIDQLIADASRSTRRTHEERVAALCLAYDLLDAEPPYRPKYTATVGKTTVRAQFSQEAWTLNCEVQALVDRINAL